MSSLGFHPTILERPRNKLEAIAALMGVGVRRGGLQLGPAAASGVQEGVGRQPGAWKDRPRHDEASHGADAFPTFACSGYTHPHPPGKEAGFC
jgi:hypothetical protein